MIYYEVGVCVLACMPLTKMLMGMVSAEKGDEFSKRFGGMDGNGSPFLVHLQAKKGL